MSFWTGKSVLVAGGTGFIGRNLALRLSQLGAKVTSAARNQSESLMPPIRQLQVDFLDSTQTCTICQDQDVMFITAALDGNRAFKASRASHILHYNTVIIMNLLEAARLSCARSVIILSSADIYPVTHEPLVFQENILLSDLMPPESTYALSKLIAEEAGRALFTEYSTNVGIARAANVYGPGDRSQGERTRVVPQWISAGFAGADFQLWSNNKTQLSFIYVADLVEGLCKFAEKVHGFEILNFAHPQPTSLIDMAQTIISVGGFKSKITIYEDKESPWYRILDTNLARMRLGFVAKTPIDQGIENIILSLRTKE